MVLADAGLGIADEAHAAQGQIVQPAEIVADFVGDRVGIERVDGEIAPCGVLSPASAECDLGVAAVGGDVMTQSGDLHRAARQNRGYRAMREAGGHGFDVGRMASGDHLLWAEHRGHVDVGDGQAQQRITHRAAHVARIARPQRRHQSGEVWALYPVGGG